MVEELRAGEPGEGGLPLKRQKRVMVNRLHIAIDTVVGQTLIGKEPEFRGEHNISV